MKIADSGDFDIRYSAAEDKSLLQTWLKSEEMLHWFPPSTDQEIESFVHVWIEFCRLNATLTAVFKNQPVGMAILYLMPYRKVAHQCMFQIIVDPKHQRQGIGRSLVKNLKHLAKNYFRLELMHAEILDENPIISLLNALDFKEFGRQERYIKEEDKYYPRILMECDL